MDSESIGTYRKPGTPRQPGEIMRVEVVPEGFAIFVFDEAFMVFGDTPTSVWKPVLLRGIDNAIDKAESLEEVANEKS